MNDLPQNPGKRPLAATLVCTLALLAIAGIGFFHVLFGELDIDEPFYVYISWILLRGRSLYTDFLYTQTPLLPYIFGAGYGLLPDTVLVARAISTSAAVAGIFFSIATAWRIRGPLAGVLASTLLLSQIVMIRNLSLAKTYSLCFLFLAAALYLLASPKNRTRAYMLAGFLLSLAVLVRLSFGVVVIVFIGYLLVRERGFNRSVLLAMIAGLVPAGIFLLPPLLADSGNFLYQVLEYHMDQGPGGGLKGILLDRWAFMERISRDFGVILGLFAAACVGVIVQAWRKRKEGAEQDLFLLCVTACVLGLFAAHFVPSSSVSEYMVVLLPTATVVVACLLAQWLEPHCPSVVACAAAVCLFAAIVGFHRGRAWFDWTFSGNDLSRLNKATALIEEHAPNAKGMLTLHPELAMQAGLEIPDRLAMVSPVYYPDIATERADKYRLVNDEVLARICEGEWDVIVITHGPARVRGLVPKCREMWSKRVETGYQHIGTIENYGACNEDFDIYVRVDSAQATPTDQASGSLPAAP